MELDCSIATIRHRMIYFDKSIEYFNKLAFKFLTNHYLAHFSIQKSHPGGWLLIGGRAAKKSELLTQLQTLLRDTNTKGILFGCLTSKID